MTTARPARPPAVTAPAPGVTQVAGVAPAAPTPRPTRTAPSPYRGSPASSWSADPYAEALRTGRGPLFLRRSDGWLLPLEVERWCAAADAADEGVLRRCEGPVLDIGCGPGRLVAALAAGGRPALGIDVSEAAVARTRRLGGQALRRSVFEPLPDEGRWGTVLLVDGNVGIGGDPVSLLTRAGELLRPGGLLLAETVPGADVDERADVRLVREPYGAGGGAGAAGAAFPWARLGAPALLRYAARAGWRPAGQWSADGRLFVALRSRHRNSSALPPKSTAVISSQRPRNPSAESAVADR